MRNLTRLCAAGLVGLAVTHEAGAVPAPAPDCVLTVTNKTASNEIVAVYIVADDFGVNLLNGKSLERGESGRWRFFTTHVSVMAVMTYGAPFLRMDVPCIRAKASVEVR